MSRGAVIAGASFPPGTPMMCAQYAHGLWSIYGPETEQFLLVYPSGMIQMAWDYQSTSEELRQEAAKNMARGWRALCPGCEKRDLTMYDEDTEGLCNSCAYLERELASGNQATIVDSRMPTFAEAIVMLRYNPAQFSHAVSLLVEYVAQAPDMAVALSWPRKDKHGKNLLPPWCKRALGMPGHYKS